MQSLDGYLKESGFTVELQSVVGDLAESFMEISDLISGGRIEGYTESKNVFGERQVKMDVSSNKILVSKMEKNPNVVLIGSEELSEPIEKEVEGKGYAVVFDPLDGSSVSDSNMTVGTIVGIYEGGSLIGKTGRDQVASLVAIYGQRLSLYLAMNGEVNEFVFEVDEFILKSEKMKIQDDGKIFAPGDLNAIIDEKWYHDALHYWLENGYKLRYSGSMAADCNLILKKGGGLFLYPGSAKNPNGKLRLLYECAPVALLMENAGGAASNGERSILDVKIDSYDQTLPFFAGSRNEVKRVIDRLG